MKTYQQFILEANQPKDDYLKTVARNIKRDKGVNVNISENPRGFRLHGIHVKPEHQGQGRGSRAIKILKGLAKKRGKKINLSASPEPGRGGDLHRFYTKRHGFKRVDKDSDTYEWNPK
jgi:GNAT superfamily N-acetyltransferase